MRTLQQIESNETYIYTSTNTRLITNSIQEAAAIVANPALFVRKWLGDAFVSVLSYHATMFVWDQCFLLGWVWPI